jgi:hypothetical protein
MSNLSAWIENLFGPRVVELHKANDEAMRTAWEDFNRPHPSVIFVCDCGKREHEELFKDGKCLECRKIAAGLKLV